MIFDGINNSIMESTDLDQDSEPVFSDEEDDTHLR